MNTNCKICYRPVLPTDAQWTYQEGQKVVGLSHDACEKARRLDEFQRTGLLTSKLTLEATLVAYKNPDSPHRPIFDACERINEAIKNFERYAWFGGAVPEMKETEYQGKRWTFPRVEKSIQSLALPVRGLSGKHDGIEMLVYSCAGRAMVTLRRGDVEITVITADDEQTDRMGQQGIHATEAEAIELLCAGTHWEDFNLKESKSVGVGL